MSAVSGPVDELVNKGFIVKRPDPGVAAGGGKTFVVTGLHRSGTTLVASVLRQAGVFMGAEINEIVHEDEAVAKILMAPDKAGLRRLVSERNADYGTWGFKFPMICQALSPADMGRFRNPHLIVTFRDPVAVAVRTSLSEYQEPIEALRQALGNQAALLSFIDRLACPVLLLSYEKALVFPNEFIEAILGFCGFAENEARRARLVQLIEPNRETYIAQARRRYEGVIDGVADGALHGWCRLTGMPGPVSLVLLVDERPVLTVLADRFRQDLINAGFGTGHHGFAVDLPGLGLKADQVIRVRVAGHDIELENSGRRLRDLDQSAGLRRLP